MTTPTLYDIIQKAIADSGADGLSNAEIECGCPKDDLAPCDNMRCGCVLAKKRELPPGGDWDFLMIPLADVEKYDREHADAEQVLAREAREDDSWIHDPDMECR